MKIKFKNKKSVKKKKKKEGKVEVKKRKPLQEKEAIALHKQLYFLILSGEWEFLSLLFSLIIQRVAEGSRAEKDQSKSKSNGSGIEQDREGESKTWGSYILLETRLCLLPPWCPFHFFLFYFLYNFHFYLYLFLYFGVD